jgi:hypothetical protein
VPYLDALRPEPGWRVELALIGSYSVDLVALAAVVLALAGLDDDRGSGSKVDLATAIELMRGRLRVLAQSGRVVAPAQSPKVLSILDTFVADINSDEAAGSWHPKVSLTKLRSDSDGSEHWRLWLGSRNLTRDMAWDTGLVLVGGKGHHGVRLSGIAELGRELSARAELPLAPRRAVFQELQALTWELPSGCAVEEVRLLVGDNRPLPDVPAGLRELIVVSPFLDGAVVGHLGQWGDSNTKRTIVSTRPELAKLAAQAGRPLRGFDEVLSLQAPAMEPESETSGEEADSADEAPEALSLHAKLIFARHRGGRSLWVGSANSTQRGWIGPNVELVARLGLNEQLSSGLRAFVNEVATTVDISSLECEPLDGIAERLEAARKQVSARWSVTLRLEPSPARLMAPTLPHPDDHEVHLAVGLLAQPMIAWPHGVPEIPVPTVSAPDVTAFVRCRLELEGKGVTWVQKVVVEPAIPDDRDQRALARYLGARAFLMWVRSMLTGDPLSEGGGDWDEPSRPSLKGPTAPGPVWWAPTLEEVLKAWTRNPELVADTDRKVRAYLKALDEDEQLEVSAEERQAIEAFKSSWSVLRRGLLGSRA